MRYYLVQQEDNPENTWYYVIDESSSTVIKQLDMNCNEVTIGVPHFIIDANSPAPPCIEQ
jgi:hypothetical protein